MIVLWIVLGLIGLLLVLLLAAVIRTLLIPGKQSSYRPDPDPERADSILPVPVHLLTGYGSEGHRSDLPLYLSQPWSLRLRRTLCRGW